MPAAPLRSRLKQRGAKAAFAKSLGISAQRLTNWLRRGVPAGMLFQVAAKIDLSAEGYLAESGLRIKVPAARRQDLPDYVELADYWPHLSEKTRLALLERTRKEAFATLTGDQDVFKNMRTRSTDR